MRILFKRRILGVFPSPQAADDLFSLWLQLQALAAPCLPVLSISLHTNFPGKSFMVRLAGAAGEKIPALDKNLCMESHPNSTLMEEGEFILMD